MPNILGSPTDPPAQPEIAKGRMYRPFAVGKVRKGMVAAA
jgi:hypothetical protein